MSVYLPIAQMSVDVFLLLMLGWMTGILSGLFGIGGGFLMTPLLIFIGIPPAVAVASVANQIITSSLTGFHSHWRKGNVDFKMGGLLITGGLLGSSLGIWIFSWLKDLGQIDLVISVCYVLFLTLIGVTMGMESGKLILRHRRQRLASIPATTISLDNPAAIETEIRDIPVRPVILTPQDNPSAYTPKPRTIPFAWLPFQVHFPRSNLHMSVLAPLLVSCAIGILVSILGIGGGFFLIPAMLYILKLPASIVIGTSLFQTIFVTANVTFLHAVTTESVDILLAGLMMIGAVFGTITGSHFNSRLREEHVRAMLAGIVLLMALHMGYTLITTPDNLYSMTLSEW